MNISFSDTSRLPSIYGAHNEHLKLLEKEFNLDILAQSNELKITGDKAQTLLAKKILKSLENLVKSGKEVQVEDVQNMILHMKNHIPFEDIELITDKSKIRPRNPKQAAYLKAVRDNNITFGVGPAGTGKTYLAVACAVEAYLSGQVQRMIFCRPAVEAGESLGFLPGDMQEKVAPYLRPIYDALFDMLSPEKVEKAKMRGEIEIAPLAFMRGRSLNHCAIVLDEAQNTTPQQMKMFLTRYGTGSKMIVCGDPSQVDLPNGIHNGLSDALAHLVNVPYTDIIVFQNEDVVRDKMVGHILDAYDASSRI